MTVTDADYDTPGPGLFADLPLRAASGETRPTIGSFCEGTAWTQGKE